MLWIPVSQRTYGPDQAAMRLLLIRQLVREICRLNNSAQLPKMPLGHDATLLRRLSNWSSLLGQRMCTISSFRGHSIRCHITARHVRLRDPDPPLSMLRCPPIYPSMAPLSMYDSLFLGTARNAPRGKQMRQTRSVRWLTGARHEDKTEPILARVIGVTAAILSPRHRRFG